MNEQPIRPGWPGHGSMPLIADSKLSRQRVEDSKLAGRVTLHYVARISLLIGLAAGLCIGGGEAGAINGWITAARCVPRRRPSQLAKYVWKFVTRIDSHRVVR